MSESIIVFNHPRTASSTESLQGLDGSSIVPQSVKKRSQPAQARQLLSCTKCRERKVKCDRTKPCSACCARGSPKECHFVAEGGDYAPIQQSYELRKLRTENLRLKERLRAARISIDEHDSDYTASPDSQYSEKPFGFSQRRRTTKQKRFQSSGWSDSIYFGSPGLASVVTDYASINLAPGASQSLSHLMPRTHEIYTSSVPPPYPFATLFKPGPDECIPQLLQCLPTTEELLEYLSFHEKRVHLCAFPHLPMEISRSEVERFLSNPLKNAQLCPDMLALIFAALALGTQYSSWDRSGCRWEPHRMKEELRKGNVYIAAAMQALRVSSCTHRPTLLGIQALIMMGPFLTNSGRFLDAWTLFGTTIRMAHAIGLHRHPKYLDPAPPTQRECSVRQTLWWWMLHMDQEYSMTLGRPLGISGIGDCPPPHELTTDPHMLRFGEFVNHFTLLARQILSSDRLTTSKSDDFTDMLKNLLETLPEMLQFDETWLDQDKEIPEWPLSILAPVFYCKVHTYIILLMRQRVEKPPAQLLRQNPSTTRGPPSSCPTDAPISDQSSPPGSPKASPRGRVLVLSSAQDVLTAFVFFHQRAPAAQITWTISQQAFNSCMLLLIDALETGDTSRLEMVERAYVVFLQLQKNGVHELASLAVERVSWGLLQLQRMHSTHSDMTLRMSTNGKASEREPEMQVAAEREAGANTTVMHDTVMGNTGMFLLEDPGLQSFIPEAFAPLTWTMGRTPAEGDHTPLRTEAKIDRVRACELPELDGSEPMVQGGRNVVSDARSSEPTRDAQGSPRSRPTHSSTFSTTPPCDYQPQQLASPISVTTHAALLHDIPRYEDRLRGTSEVLRHMPLQPHQRHHSISSLHQHAPPSLMSRPSDIGQEYKHTDGMGTSKGTQRHVIKSEGSWEDESVAVTQPFVARPSLQTMPEYIAAPAQMMPASNPNRHTTWKSPPTSGNSSVGPTLNFSQLTSRGQAPHGFTQQSPRNGIWQQTFPVHLSSTSSENLLASADTQADKTAAGEWAWAQSTGK